MNNFQIVKVQPQDVAYSICLTFCQFQPDFAYKSVFVCKSVVSYGYGIVTICEIVYFFC